VFGVCLAVVLMDMAISKGGEIWPALIPAVFVLVVAARLGIFGLGYLALLAALAVIYMGFKLWGLRTT
jgi:hypothetical protein